MSTGGPHTVLPFRWGGPPHTPRTILYLLIAVGGISLLSALFEPLFAAFSSFSPIYDLLALSWNGLRHFYLWQPLTYLFVHATPHGFDFIYCLILAFDLYIIWILSSMIQEFLSPKRTVALFVISGIAGALLASLLMWITGQHVTLVGPTAGILALLTALTILFPDDEILFLVFSIPCRLVLPIAIGLLILITLSRLDPISMVLYLGSILSGYIYMTGWLGFLSPYSILNLYERKLHKLLHPTIKTTPSDTKIIDLESGQPRLSDVDFIDLMLDKIAKEGEDSLTIRERKRLQQLAQKHKKT